MKDRPGGNSIRQWPRPGPGVENRMLRTIRKLMIAIVVLAPGCLGQSFEISTRSIELGGIHFYGVSAFSGYSTTVSPSGIGATPAAGAPGLGPDVNYGGSFSLGWQRRDGGLSVRYNGTYTGLARYTELNSFGQSISITSNRHLTPKWSLSASANAEDSSFSQFAFEPSSLSVVAQMPATFDDLAAAFAIGQFTSAQAASLLTGAPLLQSPARSLLLGDRVLSYSGQLSLDYARSSRLHFHFSSFTAAGQRRTGGGNGVAEPNYVMPRSMGLNAGMDISYALSTRTDIGVSVGGSRIQNQNQSGYSSNASFTIGRKMGMHWFLGANVGKSLIVTTSTVHGNPSALPMGGGASIGFQTYGHTLVGTYARSASDLFGFALGANTSLNGAWSFHHRGSRWSLSASFGQNQIRNTGFASISGWQASGGLTDSFNKNTSMSLQYSYVSSAGNYVGNLNQFNAQSVRLSLSWSPVGTLR